MRNIDLVKTKISRKITDKLISLLYHCINIVYINITAVVLGLRFPNLETTIVIERPPSISELTPTLFNMGLTYLGSKTSIYHFGCNITNLFQSLGNFSSKAEIFFIKLKYQMN